jgi:hypothetical protein
MGRDRKEVIHCGNVSSGPAGREPLQIHLREQTPSPRTVSTVEQQEQYTLGNQCSGQIRSTGSTYPRPLTSLLTIAFLATSPDPLICASTALQPPSHLLESGSELLSSYRPRTRRTLLLPQTQPPEARLESENPWATSDSGSKPRQQRFWAHFSRRIPAASFQNGRGKRRRLLGGNTPKQPNNRHLQSRGATPSAIYARSRSSVKVNPSPLQYEQ